MVTNGHLLEAFCSEILHGDYRGISLESGMDIIADLVHAWRDGGFDDADLIKFMHNAEFYRVHAECDTYEYVALVQYTDVKVVNMYRNAHNSTKYISRVVIMKYLTAESAYVCQYWIKEIK